MKDHPDDCVCSSCEDADDLDLPPERDEPEPPDAGSFVSPEAARREAWESKFGPGGTHRRSP